MTGEGERINDSSLSTLQEMGEKSKDREATERCRYPGEKKENRVLYMGDVPNSSEARR